MKGMGKTEEQALQSLTALCARGEHSTGEMVEKMRKWEVAEDAQARIMEYLVGNKFIDDLRFARAFVEDKITYNKWGRKKIDQALWAKGVDEKIRREVLDEVPDERYIEILKPLIKSKRRTIKAESEYETNGKLIRFAMGRGFDMDIIKKCL